MASKDFLIRLSAVFKKFGLIANEFLSVFCQFLNVGIINFSLEFYISHFGNKAINGFCNSVRFIGGFIQVFLGFIHGSSSHFNATFCRSQTIASILVGLKLLVKLVRSLVRFNVFVNRILEKLKSISEISLLLIGITLVLLVGHSIICHILASCELCTGD